MAAPPIPAVRTAARCCDAQCTADSIVPCIGQQVVNVVPIDGLALTFDQRVLNNYACQEAVRLCGINLQALEFDHASRSVDVEQIAPMERVELSVEVRLEVRRKQLVCIIVAMVVECGTQRLGGGGAESCLF